MGQVPEPTLKADEVEDAHDLALAIMPTIKGLATSHNELCESLKTFKTEVKSDIKDIYKKVDKNTTRSVEANQRSWTNKWLIGFIITALVLAGITVLSQVVGGG